MKIWKIENKSMFYHDVLGIKEEELVNVLVTKNKEKYYGKPIELPKKGGIRYIHSVDSKNMLFRLQKNLCVNFLSNLLLPETVHGFIKGTNYLEFLLPHTNFYGKNYYLRLDIKDFFGSISIDVLKEVLIYYFIASDELTKQNIDVLLDKTIDILTYNNKIIQGAPSSPVVSNIVFRSLDIRIEKYCRCFQVTYTRYADDMLFSAEKNKTFNDSFISGITKIINDKNFYINYDKTIRSKYEISLGGYVVSDTIRLSRKKLENLNRILFYIKNHKNYKDNMYYNNLNSVIKEQTNTENLQFEGIYSLINYLAGNRAFIISVLKYSSSQEFCKKAEKLNKKIEDMILKLYENIENK